MQFVGGRVGVASSRNKLALAHSLSSIVSEISAFIFTIFFKFVSVKVRVANCFLG